jgi:hypothetical protein
MQKLNYCIRAKYENHLSYLFYEKAMHTHEAKLPLQVPMVHTHSSCTWPGANTQIKLNRCIFCKKKGLGKYGTFHTFYHITVPKGF